MIFTFIILLLLCGPVLFNSHFVFPFPLLSIIYQYSYRYIVTYVTLLKFFEEFLKFFRSCYAYKKSRTVLRCSFKHLLLKFLSQSDLRKFLFLQKDVTCLLIPLLQQVLGFCCSLMPLSSCMHLCRVLQYGHLSQALEVLHPR